MINLRTEIKGPVKPLILCTLAGIVIGAVGGCFYGNHLARAALAEKVPLDNLGHVDELVVGHIESESRKAGLSAGIPIGTATGFVVGIGWAAVVVAKRKT